MTISGNRAALVLSAAAFTIAVVGAGGPAIARAFDANNAHKVDGKHAVGAAATPANRAGKLVATNASGLLPNNIIAKALNADQVDSYDSSAFLEASASTRVDDAPDPTTVAEYSDWTTLATTTITTDGSSSVLVIGSFTAQNASGNTADLFGRIRVDGSTVDGIHWETMPSGAPVFPRAQLMFHRVLPLSAGEHTITLQGSYWMGGTDQNVLAYSRSLTAVELAG